MRVLLEHLNQTYCLDHNIEVIDDLIHYSKVKKLQLNFIRMFYKQAFGQRTKIQLFYGEISKMLTQV